jgi:hypothetical protein
MSYKHQISPHITAGHNRDIYNKTKKYESIQQATEEKHPSDTAGKHQEAPRKAAGSQAGK